jgi:hypothetical protein
MAGLDRGEDKPRRCRADRRLRAGAIENLAGN